MGQPHTICFLENEKAISEQSRPASRQLHVRGSSDKKDRVLRGRKAVETSIGEVAGKAAAAQDTWVSTSEMSDLDFLAMLRQGKRV